MNSNLYFVFSIQLLLSSMIQINKIYLTVSHKKLDYEQCDLHVMFGLKYIALQQFLRFTRKLLLLLQNPILQHEQFFKIYSVCSLSWLCEISITGYNFKKFTVS